MGNRLVVMGASHGGISAWMRLVADLPATFGAPILVVQHVPPHSRSRLPELLSRAGPLPAIHPHDGELLKPGVIYVAPPDRHLLVEASCVRLSHGPKENYSRPALDPLFRSAARVFGPRVVGAVLTGQLDDGTSGLMEVEERGGTTIVQDPNDALAPSMPRSALLHVAVDHCCTMATLGGLLTELAADPTDSVLPPTARLAELEWRISSGMYTVSDCGQLEELGTPSGLNCPECMATLYELPVPRFLRFRCRTGHAFSAESLLGGRAETCERLLASTFSALLEEASLARRLSRVGPYAEDGAARARLRAQVARLEQQAEQLRRLLSDRLVLVDPLSELSDDGVL